MKTLIPLLLILLPVLGMAQARDNHRVETTSSLIEKRHERVVLQQWELSCAAAALATVLRYQFGLPVTERSVALGMINRKEYRDNPQLIRIRQGFSLLDLQRYTDSVGYKGVGLGQLSFEDLLRYAPMIVPVILQGYPHFVVFLGTYKNSVLLADPAFGNVSIPVYKFKKNWISYESVGHVGFIVTKNGRVSPPGKLAITHRDFTHTQ